MQTKLLRGDDGATMAFVYPATKKEYGRALTPLKRPNVPPGRGGAGAGREGDRPAAGGAWVVTTAAQRARWGLADLAATGRVRVVDEQEALGLLGKGAVRPVAADEPAAGAPGPPRDGGSGTAALDAVRGLVAPDARVEEALAGLEAGELPDPVGRKLGRALRRALRSQAKALEEVLDRAGLVLSLPWRVREREQFDPALVAHALDRTHGALGQVKKRFVEVLAAFPQTRGLLTVEGPREAAGPETGRAALVVRPGPPRAQALVPCLAGARGTGKTTLAIAAAEALGRTPVRVLLDTPNAGPGLRGRAGCAAGCIIRGLRLAGVNNPVFILEGVDGVDEETAGSLLDILDAEHCAEFTDDYLDVPFDLSGVVWIATATDPGAIPEAVRKRLAVIGLPGYTEHEKLVIAEEYLLKRPFDEQPGGPPGGWLAPEAVAPGLSAEDAAADGPAVLLDCDPSSPGEQALAPLSDPAEAWRTAACAGKVRFEPEALRHLIREHTSEAGVADLNARLATICRAVAGRREAPGTAGPEVVTPAIVREVLGAGDADALPPRVRAAIARERRRLGDASGADTATTNDWIEWLQGLPWTRRAEAPVELAQVRAALDAAHAGLDHAKACLLEHLAVRRRNPRSPTVLCLAGPPGVGKTSLAHCVAESLGRGFIRLSCGGLRDESDLRGHNRTWRESQPGWILREMRRVGSRDPVFVLDEVDKLGAAPAAVLLEVLDPAQHHQFRDAFVELPFDLAEVLFITTANEPALIPPALRDRLEIIDLPGYSEDEKVAIARTHLIAAQNRAAGLGDTPVRVTPGALRRIIRDYTSEPGVRQLARCLQAICRQVALGLETGDSSRVRERVTVRQVRALLGAPGAGHGDGLARLREQLAAPALPAAVRDRGRQVLAQLSAWAPTDPDHARAREYLECLLSVPWSRRTAAPALDLARARSLLDTGHAAHGAVKERLLDYVTVRLSNPAAPSPLLCLLGPAGVGKTALAALVAGALGRKCAWVACGGLGNAAALCGARSGAPGRIVDELRRVGVRNPVIVLDELDRLDEAGGASAALLDALDPAPGAAFRDRYLDLPVDLREALFVATASSLGPVPPMLRERMMVIELPGYTEAEKRAIATAHLLPRQLALHGLTADQVHVTGEAVEALIRCYTREAGVWRLRSALGEVCAKVVRHRAGGDTAPVEVTPPTLAAMLGAPMPAGVEAAGHTAPPGVAIGLCHSAHGGAVIFVEATRMAGAGTLTLTGRQGEVTQESARTALSWLRAHGGRYGLDPAFHRNSDIHLHVQPDIGPIEGASAGVTMAAALVSAVTGRAVRGDLAMSGEITLAGHVLPVGGIKEKVLAAHRGRLTGVVLPRQNRNQVDEHLGDDLRNAIHVHYVTCIDELLELVLQPVPAAGDAAAAAASDTHVS
ncbi:MAG: AAA family ATPase [Acidobacteria bacterium]|nr:AAA family ATPase [Acidobacteriota bacterium]